MSLSLHSGQVITCLASCVKELVENSIDAGATNISISGGLKEITVRDNGSGILSEDFNVIGQKYCTSKLTSLDSITSYGFRGEALSSISQLASSVRIITRTENEDFAQFIDLKDGS